MVSEQEFESIHSLFSHSVPLHAATVSIKCEKRNYEKMGFLCCGPRIVSYHNRYRPETTTAKNDQFKTIIFNIPHESEDAHDRRLGRRSPNII